MSTVGSGMRLIIMGPVEKSKGHAKNDEVQILQRRKKVAKLYCEGKSQFEIATMLGVSQPTISGDIKVVRDSWLATAILDWDEKKSQELAKIDHIEELMWEAYHRSCGLEVVRTRGVERELKTRTEGRGKDRKVVGEEMVPVKSTNKKVEKQLLGDTRYIDKVTWCVEMRCRLLGFLDHEHKAAEVNVQVINWEQVMSVRDETDHIEAEIEKVKTLPPVPTE